MAKRSFAKRGFTMVEVLMAVVLVAIAVVAIMGGIRVIGSGDAKTQDAALLQRLAAEKVGDLAIYTDPTQAGTSGDFTDRGYPDVSWSLDVQTTATTNLDQVTVTATRGSNSQAIIQLMYVSPATTTSTATTGTTTP